MNTKSFIGLCGIALIGWWMLGCPFVGVGPARAGVFTGPNGKSVLIQGSACVVNDTSDISDAEFNQGLRFCAENRHR